MSEVEHIYAPHSFKTYTLHCDVPTAPSSNGYSGLCGKLAYAKYVDLTGEYEDKYMCIKHYKEWQSTFDKG